MCRRYNVQIVKFVSPWKYKNISSKVGCFNLIKWVVFSLIAHIKNWAGSSLVYLHCSVAFTKQFWKFNERPQGRTWLDAFFVQKNSQSILCKLKSFRSEGAILSSKYRYFMLNYFIYINMQTNIAISYLFRYLTSKLFKVLKNVLSFFTYVGKIMV